MPGCSVGGKLVKLGLAVGPDRRRDLVEAPAAHEAGGVSDQQQKPPRSLAQKLAGTLKPKGRLKSIVSQQRGG
jgi:hypothetical protein